MNRAPSIRTYSAVLERIEHTQLTQLVMLPTAAALAHAAGVAYS
jgi:hypothetical protein